MKKINKILAILIPGIVAIILGLILIANNGKFLILGGEGNYFLDIKQVIEFYQYSWAPLINGTGTSNPLIHLSFPIFYFFELLQNLGIHINGINLISIFLLYFLPFISFYFLLVYILKIDYKLSFLVSLFYVINPYTTTIADRTTFFNIAPFVILPLTFAIIYKYYDKEFKLFFYFGLLVILSAFGLANIPYLGIFHVFLPISLIIISYLINGRFELKKIIKKFLILELSFILFSFWWLLNLIRIQFQELGQFYNKDFALNWAKYASGDGGIITRIFSLTTTIPSTDTHYYFSQFYNNPLVFIVLLIPFMIILFGLILKYKENKYILPITTLLLLIVFFLNKGINAPFSLIYSWLLKNVPLFLIFKSPLEKFSILLIFLTAISLVFIFKEKKYKLIYSLFVIYLIVCTIPYLTLNFIPDREIGGDMFMSRNFIDKPEYIEVRNLLNSEKLDYRILSLPGSLNYQITMKNHDNKYYRGMDPILYAINKPFIAAYSGENFNLVYSHLSTKEIEKILSIYNINSIMLNQDIYPSFGFKEKETPEELDQLFTKKFEKWESGSIKLFKNTFFLPHFYTPQNIILSNQSMDALPEIVSQANYQIRSAIIFTNQSENINKTILNNLPSKIENTPTLEFKKINPTKYRVFVHNTSESFPLVFSESFHNGWKVYQGYYEKPNMNTSLLDNYKILDGNDGDQATKEEINQFIEQGLISSLGDSKERTIKHMKWVNNKEKLDYEENYTIDFISKNFQGTIQNDNLDKGHFYETWLQKPIVNESNHLMANGYANSWIINITEICETTPDKCIKNPDGTYDLELVIEFWPQRLFYLGLIISGTTLLCCIGYLVYDWRKGRRKGKEERQKERRRGKKETKNQDMRKEERKQHIRKQKEN